MNRVAITGLGVVTPLGNSIAEFRDNLLQGKSGVGAISIFDAADLPCKIAAECRLDRFEFKDRKMDFALVSADAAVKDACSSGMPLLEYYPETERALSIGLGLELFDMNDMVYLSGNNYVAEKKYLSKIDFLQSPSDFCVEALRKRHGLRLQPAIHISACASGSDAIGYGFYRVRRGDARMVIAGGTDSMINPLGVGGFCKLNALSTRNDFPSKASRPFDVDRDGFVLGEGAGMIVLENLEDAVKRGATIYAEIAGFANSFDAYSVSEPHPEGKGAYHAMANAVKMAGIKPQDISYINAHGTSTPKNDTVETIAIKRLLGEYAAKVPVSSTKSMIGHLIASAGAVEAIASIICARIGKVHPTINLNKPDPLCDLDYVPNLARTHKVGFFLSNSFAFGGMNSTVVFKNWKE